MKNKPLDVHPLADEEASQAFEYYRDRDAGVGERFKIELARCFKNIDSRPLAFQRYLLDTRRCLLKRFPYLVVFQETAETWLVIAVVHCRRKPGYWIRRLK